MEQEPRILMDHGSGGMASAKLVRQILSGIGTVPDTMEDSAVLTVANEGRVAFSTDSYVVDPIFFPGGDIGELAVNGTVNDLAMRGAVPKWLSMAFIIEEGFSLSDLDRIAKSVGTAARRCGVEIVTGDTKVVPTGCCDRIFINSSGIGVVPPGVKISAGGARHGDAVLLSGTCGDHGITVMTCRAGIPLSGELRSDTAPLNDMVNGLVRGIPVDALHVMRDPTRGGVATALNEIAEESGLAIEIDEASVPVDSTVKAACEILGLDPLYLANEGKMLLVISDEHAEKALDIMRSHHAGRASAIIGHVRRSEDRIRVTMTTAAGGRRALPALHGNPLPRIC